MFPFAYPRRRVPELMDDPAIDPAELRRALMALRRVNRLSRSDAILWPRIQELARAQAPRPLRILDVATGSGDVPMALFRRLQRQGWACEIEGTDFSPTATNEASIAAQKAMLPIRFFTHDILREPIPGKYDIVISSLFLHHLDPPEATQALRRMAECARQMVMINDLRRCKMGWWAAVIGTRLLTRSPVVHFDGPASVNAAFTPEEAMQLAADAGCTRVTVQCRFPWRFLMEIRTSEAT